MALPDPAEKVELQPGRYSRAVLGAVLFAGTYMAAAVIRAATTGNMEFVFYIVVMLVLAGAVGIVHRNVRLSAGVIWALSLWGFAHMAGGLVPVAEGWPVDGKHHVLYSLWLIPESSTGGAFALKYDQVVHAYGFGVTTWLCWECLRAVIGRNISRAGPDMSENLGRSLVRPTAGVLVLCVAAGMGFGALNELVEFTATRLTDTNVGGYENTGWDLVSNTVGCIVAACIVRWSRRRAGVPA